MKNVVYLFLLASLLCAKLSSAQQIYLSTFEAIYTFDVENCTYNLLTEVNGPDIFDICVSPGGDLYGITNSGELFFIDTNSGNTNIIHTFSGFNFNSLTCSSNSTIYVTGAPGDIWTYNLLTGEEDYIGNLPYTASGDLTFNDGELYVAITGDRIVKINLNDVSNSEVVVDDNVPSTVYGIFSNASSCQEVTSYAATYTSGNGGTSGIFSVNFEENEYVFLCQLQIGVTGGASDFEFLASDPILVNDINLTLPVCPQSNGEISIDAIGGLGQIFYQLDNNAPQTDPVFNNLFSDYYVLSIFDENGCIITDTIDLIAPNTPVVESFDIIHPSCGLENGQVEVIVSSGTGELQYLLNNSAYSIENIYQNLAEGSYQVSVIDELGCETSDSFSLISPQLPLITDIQISNTTCNGANGSILVEGTGLALMYSVTGSPFQANNSFNNLESGDLTVLLRDENDCETSSSIIIPNNGEIPTIDSIYIDQSTCEEDNGSIIVNSTGGEGIIEYGLDAQNLQTSNQFQELAAGSYSVIVQDGYGCLTSEPFQMATSLIPSLQIGDIQNIDCNHPLGSVNALVSNGTAPFNFTLNNETNQDGFFQDLFTGDFELVILDAFECTSSISFSIDSIFTTTIDSVVFENTSCGLNNGIITPFTSDNIISLRLNNEDVEQNIDLVNLSAGNYDLYSLDINDCPDSIEVIIGASEKFKMDSILIQHTTCSLENGAIFFSTNESLNSVQINGSDEEIQYEFSKLGEGYYDIYTTNIFDCPFDTTVIIEASKPILGNIETISSSPCSNSLGTINLDLEDYTGQIQLYLNNEIIPTEFFISNLEAREYNLLAVDENNCLFESDFEILQGKCDPFVPNIINRTSTIGNEIFQMFFSKNFKGSLIYIAVFDRWGNRVFFSNDIQFKWDLSIDNQNVESGVYTYVYEVLNQDLTSSIRTGSVTIID